MDAPLANTITLGVQDLVGTTAFYRALGWPQIVDSGDFMVFELRGTLLALFPVEQLGRDACVPPESGRGGIRTAVIINVDRPGDVDELVARARTAGARVTKEPTDAEFFDGRDAYFADPEGNFWEIACAPVDNPGEAGQQKSPVHFDVSAKLS